MFSALNTVHIGAYLTFSNSAHTGASLMDLNAEILDACRPSYMNREYKLHYVPANTEPKVALSARA
jgi:hypothetical protein